MKDLQVYLFLANLRSGYSQLHKSLPKVRINFLISSANSHLFSCF